MVTSDKILEDFVGKCLHADEKREALYTQADTENSFKCLVNYPCLLFRWQLEHDEDIKRIATLSSHKLGRHKFCDTPEKCNNIETFIKSVIPGQITLTYGTEAIQKNVE